MEYREISRATISRLPRYLNFIQKLPKHIRYISATAISKALELGEVQVRKDLSAVCGSGRPKIGYEVDTLCKALECALGVHTECEAVIVGAGRLGMALLGFKGFAEYGITIEKAFDSNKEKCGGSVLPMEKLSEYCSLHHVEIGILTVPSECAQAAAEQLVSYGVKAIWCFAATRLEVPENVMVCYENLALSLAHLRQKMKISGRK